MRDKKSTEDIESMKTMETLPNARRVEPSTSHRFILPFCGRFAVSYASTCVWAIYTLSVCVCGCVCVLGYALVCLKQKICLSYHAHLYAMLGLFAILPVCFWHVASRT